MPFVEACDQRGSQHRQNRPAQSPLCAHHDRQSFAPGAEQQNAQQAVTENVSALADEEVPMLEVGVVHPQ